MLPEITRRVGAPRALAVPFPLGWALGGADDPDRQHAVLDALLALCEQSGDAILATLPEEDRCRR